MFQDSLFESRNGSGCLKTTKARYLSLVSLAFNVTLLLMLLLWPLLHLQSLPKQALAMLVVAPSPPATPAHVTRAMVAVQSPTQPQLLISPLDERRTINRPTSTSEAPPTLEQSIGPVDLSPGGLARNLGDTPGAGGPSRAVVLAHLPPSGKVIISSGVMAGNRVAGPDPTYPAIARQARIEGTVVLGATISKTGTIENLRVLSGPPMLVGAAIMAVKAWRYKPYLLNEQPVEVETTINIVFSLEE